MSCNLCPIPSLLLYNIQIVILFSSWICTTHFPLTVKQQSINQSINQSIIYWAPNKLQLLPNTDTPLPLLFFQQVAYLKFGLYMILFRQVSLYITMTCKLFHINYLAPLSFGHSPVYINYMYCWPSLLFNKWYST